MKKQITQLSLVALGLVSVAGFSTTTFAEEDDNVVSSAISNATITAVPGTNPVAPVDPTDPTNPNRPGPNGPDEGNVTGQSGPLQINYLSNLDFGDDVEITSRSVEANVKNKTPRFFQVSDLRGTGGGWELNVVLGDFNPTNQNSTAGPITGAKISFSNGQAVTSNDSNEDAAVVSDLILDAGSTDTQTLLSASEGNGRGTWLARFTADVGASDNANIVFSAPTNSISANTNYEATLTWQLVDGAN